MFEDRDDEDFSRPDYAEGDWSERESPPLRSFLFGNHLNGGSDYGASRGPSFKTCDRCGESGFIWKETENGWRLATVNGALHKCAIPESVLKAFDDLP